MRTLKIAAAFLLMAAATYFSGLTVAQAQVPPHTPGSICATPNFWCWAATYGAVGAPCSCPAAQGYAAGVYV